MFELLRITRLAGLLDWSDRDKVILNGVVALVQYLFFALWIWLSWWLSDAGGDLSSSSGVRLTGEVLLASMGGWVFFILWGLVLRRQGAESRLYPVVFMFYYGAAFVALGQMIGLYSPLTGIVLLGSSMAGVVLFGFPRVLAAFAFSLVLIFILASLSVAGYIEYAPLLSGDPVTKTHVSAFWVTSIIACSVPYVGSVLVLMFVLLHRWHEREAEVRRLSSTDPLTGLANRRALFRRFEREMNRARRSGEPVTVCMMDLDHFKHINDQYGHGAGDLVLQKVGRVLQRQLRELDLIGRIGGEEFVLVLPDTGHEAALPVLERCREEIEKLAIRLPDDPVPLSITASFGAYTCVVEQSTVLAQLLARADEALYRAKRDGRNRLVRWSDAVHEGLD